MYRSSASIVTKTGVAPRSASKARGAIPAPADAAPPRLLLFFPEELLPSPTERLPLAAMSEISRAFGAEAILTPVPPETKKPGRKVRSPRAPEAGVAMCDKSGSSGLPWRHFEI